MSIPGGIVAYRSELRRKGGVISAGSALAVGTLGGVLLLLPGRLSGVVGFALVIAAFPLLVAFGIPIASGLNIIALGASASIVLWFLLGQWAAFRATRRPIADWHDWWSVMWPLVLAMMCGGFVGFGLFALSAL